MPSHPECPRVQSRAQQHDLIDACLHGFAKAIIDQPHPNGAAVKELVRQRFQLCPTLRGEARARRIDEMMRERVVI